MSVAYSRRGERSGQCADRYTRSGEESIARRRLIFVEPVTYAQVLFHLTAFVPVLVGFVGTTVDVPELMFWISDQFGQDLRSFAHGFYYLLSEI